MTQPREIRRYGWIPDQPDERDHLYAAPPEYLLALPASTSLTARPQFWMLPLSGRPVTLAAE